jgi:two-component system response regulator (stage 0 sporulation protein F)
MPKLNGLDMFLELAREFLQAKVIAISGARGEKNVLDVAKPPRARQTFEKSFSLPHLLGAVRYELDICILLIQLDQALPWRLA